MEHLAVVRQNSIWPLAGSLVVQWIDTPKALRLEVLTPDIIGAVVSTGVGVGAGTGTGVAVGDGDGVAVFVGVAVGVGEGVGAGFEITLIVAGSYATFSLPSNTAMPYHHVPAVGVSVKFEDQLVIFKGAVLVSIAFQLHKD